MRFYKQIALAGFLSAALLGGLAAQAKQMPATPPAPAPAQTAPQPAAAPTAAPKIESQPAFYVVGILARTKNADEAKGEGAIPALWQRFMSEGTAAAIPDKVGEEVYVVYSNYESDQYGSYDYLIGTKVSSIDHVPAGMVAKQVQAGHYAVVTSESGPVQEIVPGLWQKIWTMTPDQLGGKRALKSDFEVYDLRNFDPQNAQIEAHIGLQ